MSENSEPGPPPPDDRGFALVLVLWVAGLLAVMTASLSSSVRTHVRVAANVAESARAEALADSGITLAVMDLMSTRRGRGHQRRFSVDGQGTLCLVPGEGALNISVIDEASRIDVNTAGVPLIQALVAGLGEPPEKAAQIAEAIFDYRDADDERKPNGAEAADYRAAGLGWLPKNGPLQSVDELAQVYGMTPELLARMRPYLTVYSGLAGIDATLASERLITLLRNGLAGTAGAFGSFPDFHESVALPAMFVTASQQRVFTLRVEALSAAGAVFVREAIVDVGTRQTPKHVFLRWTRGPGDPGPAIGIPLSAGRSLC
ncbi:MULTISPECIES: type II secretion system protein GspK [Rhodomicrobium]|uniref:general secretion pathway protein GspK n=1 Tax=Rhodomicrobium TaxID=1068 RepID=UPI000B4B3B00|nr:MULTISPECIES: type II secretion system protein GspK [Rhodomicrobium]